MVEVVGPWCGLSDWFCSASHSYHGIVEDIFEGEEECGCEDGLGEFGADA